MESKFNEEFVYSEGEQVNIIQILKILKINSEESRGSNFKEWTIKNKVIKEPFDIETDGRTYYLKDYKERNKKTIKFNRINSPTRSVMSGGTIGTIGTIIPEDF